MTRQLWRIFAWQAARDLRRHPALAALNTLSIALGITVYLAIQMANSGASRAFAATVDLTAGKAQLEVRGTLDEALWPRLEQAPGIQAATAVVEGVATLPDFPGEYLRLVGVDLFSGEPFRTVSPNEKQPGWDLERWLGQPGQIAISAALAKKHGWRAGDHLQALVNGERRLLTILTLLETDDTASEAEPRVALMDIGWAQELFGRAGQLSAVQLLVDKPDHAEAIAASLNQWLPADAQAAPPRQRSFQLQHMVSAFQLNLTALSMVSLLVGVFLIYNTISAAVTRRRREIGILRAIGATRLEIRALFLGEALFFGLAGVALGCVAGTALAQTLSAAVERTITSLYVLVSIAHPWPSVWHFATAALFGSLAALTGAWLPAAEAAHADPVAALAFGSRAEHAGERAADFAWLGLATLGAGALAALGAVRGGPPMLGFVAAFGVITGASLFSHVTLRGFARAAVTFVAQLGVIWRLAAENLARSAHRHAMTVAALSSAVAMLTGLSVMIFSFRASVNDWIGHGIVADLFIAPASNEQIGLGADVPPAALDWLRARPEIASVDTIREQRITVKTAARPQAEQALLLVIGGAFRHNLQFRGGDDDARAAQVFAGTAVAVTESFARRFKVRENDPVTIPTPRGLAAFPIAGIYSDYSHDQGVILMSRPNFDQRWDEPGVHSLAVFLQPGADGEKLSDAFRQEFSRAGEFSIYSNRALRARILTVFDQTFAVTSILRTVALLVAITGVYLSSATLVAEREREIGMLRAIGASRGQIQGLLMVEAALLGLVSALLGLASGTLLALVLTEVVNPAFFGWTIQLHFPWLPLALTPLWVAAAALTAAWRPARQAADRRLAETLREE